MQPPIFYVSDYVAARSQILPRQYRLFYNTRPGRISVRIGSIEEWKVGALRGQYCSRLVEAPRSDAVIEFEDC